MSRYCSITLKKRTLVFTSKETPKYWPSFVTKDFITALKLFPVVCCYDGEDGGGLKLEKLANLCLEKIPKKIEAVHGKGPK